MGSGGIGAYTGGRLAAAGVDVGFVARGAQLAALREKGLTILSPRGDVRLGPVRASDNPADIGVADVIVFSVKLWDTDTAAQMMKPMVGPDTLVMTFQNGVDSAEMIARHVPRKHVIHGNYFISAHLAAPGVVDDTGPTNLMVVSSRDAGTRLAGFKEICDRAVGLIFEISDADEDLAWSKFVGLTAFAGSTALMRKPIGEIMSHPETRQFVRDLLDEAAAVAFAKGIRLPPDAADRRFSLLAQWAPNASSSMAVDLMHGRRLELPWLSGRVHQLGIELGIPTPAHTAVLRGLVLHEMGSAG